MQGAEDQMARAGSHQGQLDGFQVAQFAHQDDVRILAQGAAQGSGKRLGMNADFTMVNQAVLALMHEFDRIFDGDDMIAAVLVDVIHHGGERGGLARAGGAGDHDQTAVQHAELLQHVGERGVELLKVLEGENFGRNLAEDCPDAILLVEEIGAEAGDVRDLVTEVHVAGFFKHLDLILGRDLVEHLLEFIAFERRMVHAMQLTIDPEHRVVARRKVQVRSLLLEHQVEECIYLCHNNLYCLSNW